MEFLLFVKGILIGTAHAQAHIYDLGGSAVGTMWDQIRSTFEPYSTGTNLIQNMYNSVLHLFQAVVGTAAVISIVYAGIIVATSASEDKIAEAKKIVTYALVGFIILMIGPIILAYMRDVIIPLMFQNG